MISLRIEEVLPNVAGMDTKELTDDGIIDERQRTDVLMEIKSVASDVFLGKGQRR